MRASAVLAALLAAGLALPDIPACAEQRDLSHLVALLQSEDAPDARGRLVTEIAGLGTPDAVRRLGRIAREDPSVAVRVRAVGVLGDMARDEAGDSLVELAAWGGVRAVRSAVGAALARRQDGTDLVAARLGAERLDALTAERLTDVLADIPGEPAPALLGFFAGDEDAVRRVAALQALARRPTSPERVSGLVLSVLDRFADVDSVVAALDLAAGNADARIRPAATAVLRHPDPAVRPAAEAALAWVDYLDACERRLRQAAGAAGAGSTVLVPAPPRPRPRVDLVFEFECRASLALHAQSLRTMVDGEIARRNPRGLASVRVGIVGPRDPRYGARDGRGDVVPMTHDLSRVRAFLGAALPRRAAPPGADVERALHQGLDRMTWRPEASRTVCLVADSKLRAPARATAIARDHFGEDGTALTVWFVRHADGAAPGSLVQLARTGGGAFLEITRGTPAPLLPGLPGLPAK